MRTAGSWAVGLWRRLLAFHMSHPGAALAVWLSLAVLSMAYAYFCLKFEPSQKALISQHNRLIQRLRVADRFSRLDAFIVAVENRDTPKSIAFADALAARLRADPKHFTQVFYRIEPKSLRPWALRYLSESTSIRLSARCASTGSSLAASVHRPACPRFWRRSTAR